MHSLVLQFSIAENADGDKKTEKLVSCGTPAVQRSALHPERSVAILFAEVERMKIYDISREILSTKPYGTDPVPKLKKITKLEKDGYNLSRIEMSLHAATHVDAPLHFIKEGADIAGFPADVFVGPCTVMSVPSKKLDAMFFMTQKFEERLILRGGGELTGSAIGYLYSRGLKLVGTDRESIGSPSDERTTHVALLGYGIAILENLDLSGVRDGDYCLSAAPLKIKGGEAAPCRAVLIEK